MKRHVRFRYLFSAGVVEGTIIIDKDGMRVEDKSPISEADSYFYNRYIEGCLDIGQWKHSHHISVRDAMHQGTDERKEVKRILKSMIDTRRAEIQQLKDGARILSKCK